MKRLCVLCRNCAFDTRTRGARDGGARGSIWCAAGKRIPDVSAPLVGQREFLEWNALAHHCKHYDPVSVNTNLIS